MERVNVGIIGCGHISDHYCQGLKHFRALDLRACADMDMSRAKALASDHGIAALTVDQLLADPDIEIVVNLTPPAAHFDVAMQVIAAGKHVHNEKPLAQTRDQGQTLLQAAADAGLRLGCAPDTFLGGGLQTSRKLLDDGWIGAPVAACGFFASHGPDSYHPTPDFFFKPGGGPLFDMAPYYLTALIHLIGPVERVTGSASKGFERRYATNKDLPPDLYGYAIDVEVDTHVSAVLDFANGSVASLISSFDTWHHNLPFIEIFGTEGTLSIPDPNHFRGPVRVRRANAEDWSEMPLTHDASMLRGVGVADLAYSLKSGRPHRASGALAWHVLDLMHAILDSADSGQHQQISSGVSRPEPLPAGLAPGQLDD
ncbi:MAG: Gfo/Idh/MocA family oxidoreductase [Anaerolineae bacterium]|nr:Gfo/Idh/MocA family oxidoreductase [Anaerolineae bacterium]